MAVGPSPVMALVPLLIVAFVLFSFLSVLLAFFFCRIFAKAGWHWALGLIVLVPIINLAVVPVLALAKWPIQTELEELKKPGAAIPVDRPV